MDGSLDAHPVDALRYYRPDERHPERLAPVPGTAPDLTAAAVHGAFRGFIEDVGFPCVGAKSALHDGSYRLGLHAELGSDAAVSTLSSDLTRFLEELPTLESRFATYVSVFEGPQGAEPAAFEKLLWQTLQGLHDVDGRPWDEAVSADPKDPHFSFSFGGTAFYVVGLSPTSERISRRFPWPALAWNSHAQFERLREAGGWERMQDVIRARDIALQGSVNPMLRDHGTVSEAAQYSGRAVSSDWRPPLEVRSSERAGACPFHAAARRRGETP